jgi:hypothetical protein
MWLRTSSWEFLPATTVQRLSTIRIVQSNLYPDRHARSTDDEELPQRRRPGDFLNEPPSARFNLIEHVRYVSVHAPNRISERIVILKGIGSFCLVSAIGILINPRTLLCSPKGFPLSHRQKTISDMEI